MVSKAKLRSSLQIEARPLAQDERSFLEGIGVQLEKLGCQVTAPNTYLEDLMGVQPTATPLEQCLMKLGWMRAGGNQDCKFWSRPDEPKALAVYPRARYYIGVSSVNPSRPAHPKLHAAARLKGTAT